jgi:hypothetical protein
MQEQWRRVGSRAAVRNSTGRGDLEWLPPLFTFLPVVRFPSPAKRIKNTQTTVDFISFFFRSISISF